MRAQRTVLVLLLLLLITVPIALIAVGRGEMVAYIPICIDTSRRDDPYSERPDMLTKEHVERMKAVLRGYREPFEIREGRLYILKRLQHDKDLLANYTDKALSPTTWPVVR